MKLLKHHVIRCPKCGLFQCSYSKINAKCKKCEKKWKLIQRGMTIGVYASYWRPCDASEHVKRLKARRE
jgi:DNA-directed RNA polymerase subunit RPC12/RpoP